MITQRAWLVGVIGFCFYLIAVVNTLPSFYLALTWLSMGVLGSSLAIALLSLIGLRCAWRAPGEIVSQTLDENSSDELTSPVVEIQFANAGTLNKTGIVIEVLVRRETENSPEKSNAKAQILTRRFLMEALPSASSLTTEVPLAHLPRGRYRVEELRLIGSDVLGLFRIQKRVPPGEVLKNETFSIRPKHAVDNEILVGPATVHWGEALPSPRVSARGNGGVAAPRFLGQGDEMRGTRLYTPGDDLRHVHWKSTARKGELVVKEFHHTLQTRVLIVWDGDASTPAKRAPGKSEKSSQTIDEAALEGSLSLAASLCRAFEGSRQPGALLKLDAQPLWIGSRDNSGGQNVRGAALNSGPGLGPNGATSDAPLAMEQVARALATAHMDRETTLAAAVSTLGGGWPAASEVFLVTASLAVEVAQCVSQWRAAGAHVAVALVKGAAFGSEANSKNENSKRESFGSQVLRLREAGARVVEVDFSNALREVSREGYSGVYSASQQFHHQPDYRNDHQAQATTLRRALHELLKNNSVGNNAVGNRAVGSANAKSASTQPPAPAVVELAK